MVAVTSLGGRAVVLAASALAHVALAAVAVTGGHAPASARAPSETPSEIAIDVTAPAIEAPVAQAPARAIPSPLQTHTHPYPVPLDHDAHPHDPSLVHTALAPRAHDDDHDHDVTHAAEPREAAAVVNAAPAEPARFTIAAGGANVSFGAVASGASGVPDGTGAHDEANAPIVEASSLGEPAKRVSGLDPVYPEAARGEGIEAEVPVEIVIDARGMVESARATRHVGYGLDEAATRAVRGWRFTPRTKSGHPVRVRMVWPVVFKLTN